MSAASKPIKPVTRHKRGPAGREELARLHVRGLANRAIAKRVGVDEATICRWLKEPEVQKRIADLGAEANREVKLILERAAPEAARTMLKCLRGQGGKSAALRKATAEAILDRTGHTKSERREVEHTVQGNAGALRIALAIERMRERRKPGD